MKLFFCLLTTLSLFAQYPKKGEMGASCKLFAGSSSRALAIDVSNILHIPLSSATVARFHDGEIRIQIQENIRGSDVYIFQSTSPSLSSSINDNLLELFFLIRACKRACASSVTAIIPYYAYARQDRMTDIGETISASDVALLLETAGVDHVMAIDLHSGQIQGFFQHTTVDDLNSLSIFVPYIANQDWQNLVIVSPDAGGVPRAKKFQLELDRLNKKATLATLIKQRSAPGEIQKMDFVGTVQDCDALIIDDLCDTAGTLCEAAHELKKHGAKRIFACITHPVFSPPALERIAASPLEELLVTNTIALSKKDIPKIHVLSVAPLLAEVLRRSFVGEPIEHLELERK